MLLVASMLERVDCPWSGRFCPGLPMLHDTASMVERIICQLVRPMLSRPGVPTLRDSYTALKRNQAACILVDDLLARLYRAGESLMNNRACFVCLALRGRCSVGASVDEGEQSRQEGEEAQQEQVGTQGGGDGGGHAGRGTEEGDRVRPSGDGGVRSREGVFRSLREGGGIVPTGMDASGAPPRGVPSIGDVFIIALQYFRS